MDFGNDDLIQQILQESQSHKVDISNAQYTVDSLLNDDGLGGTYSDIKTTTNPESITTTPDMMSSLLDSSLQSTNVFAQKKVEEPKKAPELKIPDYKDPLEFVQFIELEQHHDKQDQKFYLQKHKKENKTRLNSLEIIPLIELSRLIFDARNRLQTAMGIKNDNVLIGDVVGKVSVYSQEKKAEMKQLISSDKSITEVTCIDFTEEGDFVIIGYKNGYLGLFELSSGKCKTVLKEVHFSPVLAVRFYKREPKFMYILSSDDEGNVNNTTIKDGFFGYKMEETKNLYCINKEPTFLIKVINFTNEEKETYPFLNNFQKGILFSSISGVYLYTVENLKELFRFERPDYLKENFVPDATIGIGKPPDLLKTRSHDVKPQLLLSISWGKVIYLFVIPVMSGKLTKPGMLGYFVNTTPILRMGFLTGSLIYFLDSQKFVKVINSRQVNIGKLEIQSDLKEPICPPENCYAILEDGKLVDPELKSQINFKDKTGQQKASYLNFILEDNKTLYLLGKQTLYNSKLLKWTDCLNALLRNNEWLDLLTIGIEIYHARMPALSDIPQKEAERKQVIGKFLQNSISQYVIYCFGGGKTTLMSDESLRQEIDICIDTTIEFCIEIEAVQFLLTELLKKFQSKEKGEDFLTKLEPFIICDRIKDVQLNEDIVLALMDLYQKQRKLETLSQILIHLNINSIDQDKVRKKCEDWYLITPLIYIYMYGRDENYFTPVEKMFDQYTKAVPIKNFSGYKEEYEKLVEKDIEIIRKSQQYLGHRLLWYIKWVLTGKKFPDGKTNMKKEKFNDAIANITFWLFSRKAFDEFIRLDEKNYFDILKTIFNDSKLYSIICELNSNTSKEASELKIKTMADIGTADTNPDTLIESLYSQCKYDKSSRVVLDLNEFIAKASKNVIFTKERSLTTAEYLLLNYCPEMTKDDPNEPAKIGKNLTDKEAKKLIEKIKEKIPKEDIYNLSDDIINLFREDTNFEQRDYIGLIQKVNEDPSNPFDLVKLFLYKQVGDYRKSLEVYIADGSYIPKKEEKTFTWINMSLTKLKQVDKDKFESLKTDIEFKICRLGHVSVEKLLGLVNTWFVNEKMRILEKLKEDPELELRYIELLLIEFKKNLQANDNEYDDDEPQNLSYILKTHIELLCQLDRKKEILPCLEKGRFYPLDECLALCERYGVTDASIYLYLITGSPNKALKLSLEQLKETKEKLISNIKKNEKDFNSNAHTMLMKEFGDNLLTCINVCEKNDQKLEDLWFDLLSSLYNFNNEITSLKKEQSSLKNNAYLKEMEEMISKDIKELLEKMYSFVSIKKIIEEVTNRYKNAEFKEFKILLTQMLSTYSNITKIMISAKELLQNTVLLTESELIKVSARGNDFTIEECEECKQKFAKRLSSEEVIVIFKCGHMYHEECVMTEGNLDEKEAICRACRKEEIDSSLGSSSTILNKKNSIIPSKENGKEGFDEFKFKNFKKMSQFDKKISEKKKALYQKALGIKI